MNSCRVVSDIRRSSTANGQTWAPAHSRCPQILETTKSKLLDLDLRAAFFQLLLHGVAFFFRDTGLHGLRSAFDQILRLFQTEAGKFANDLDDLDLLIRRSRHKHDVERRLLFGWRCGRSTCSGGGGGNRRGSRDAESGL